MTGPDMPPFSLQQLPLLPLLGQLFHPAALLTPNPWKLKYANAAFAAWLGESPDALIERPLESVFSGQQSSGFIQQIEQFWRSDRPTTELKRELMVNGRPRTVLVRACLIHTGGQPLLGLVMQPEGEVPKSRHAERQDPLTELPDRTFLLTRIAALMQGGSPDVRSFAVLFVDLDNFKQVNDAFGHLIGDRVLREVGQRLAGCVREGDHVVRFGGDEFVVLVEDVEGPAEVEPIVRRINAVLADPIAMADGEVTLSASIGAAEWSPGHLAPEDVIAAADRAMYASKRSNA